MGNKIRIWPRPERINPKSRFMKKVLLGNEAIVQGALEAGVDFVSVYPGTPSSEIGNIFSQIAKKQGIYFEFSVNEKIAMEAAIGASFSGLKCLVAMKSFGLNVASEALIPFCYTGTKGPVVIVVADDPFCHSSGQSEQNTRAFVYSAHIPMLEPSDGQEAKDFVKLGFEVSEKYNIPVIVRTTTRVAHQRMPVSVNSVFAKASAGRQKSKRSGEFIKDPRRFVTMPPRVLEMKKELLAKIEKIKLFAEKNVQGRVSGRKDKIGIIVSGVSYLYIKEVLEKANLDLPILKLSFFYPLAGEKIKNFIRPLKKVLIAEELEPFLEKETERLAKEVNCELKIFGKNVLPEIGELDADKIESAINKLLGRKDKKGRREEQPLEIPKRYPRLCQGCPYWFVFSAVKELAPKNTIFGGDIGCYMLAGFPPHNLQDYLLCMGSSIGIGHGIKKAGGNKQKLIAFIGDSTFFHSGIPALINSVYNQSNLLVIVMDNRITAMTGHQPNPGMGLTGMGEKSPDIRIEDIVRACGVNYVKTIDPQNISGLKNTIKNFLEKKEVSVIIAKRMCALLAKRLANKKR